LFGSTPGVIQTSVGYAGGKKKHPTYQNLGDHTEVVQIQYDPCRITFKQLLSLFWKNHNPSIFYQKQYWSIIFYITEEQKLVAQDFLQLYEKESLATVYTQIIPLEEYYHAESYHQKYTLQTHPWLIVAVNVRSAKELIQSQVCTKFNGFLSSYGTHDELLELARNFGLNDRMVEYISREMMKTTMID